MPPRQRNAQGVKDEEAEGAARRRGKGEAEAEEEEEDEDEEEEDDDDDDDDEEGSRPVAPRRDAPAPTPSAAAPPAKRSRRDAAHDRVLGAMGQEERTRIEKDALRFLVFALAQRGVVKRSEFSKEVMRRRGRGAAGFFIEDAGKRLRALTGVSLVELPRRSDKEVDTFYALVDADNGGPEFAELAPEEARWRGQVMVVLSLLAASNWAIRESDLREALGKLGLAANEATELVRSLVDQHYLLRARSKGAEPGSDMLSLGARAERESSRDRIFTFLARSVMNEEPDEDVLKTLRSQAQGAAAPAVIGAAPAAAAAAARQE
jgi:hypothetical protein